MVIVAIVVEILISMILALLLVLPYLHYTMLLYTI